MCIYDVAKRCLRLCKKNNPTRDMLLVGSGPHIQLARCTSSRTTIQNSLLCLKAPQSAIISEKDFEYSWTIHIVTVIPWKTFKTEVMRIKSYWDSHEEGHTYTFILCFLSCDASELWALTETQGLNIWMIDIKKGRLNNYRWIPAILVSSTIHNLNFLLGIWRLAFFHAFNFHRLVVDFLSALGGHLHQHVTIQVALGCTIEGCLPAAATVARSKSGGQRCFKVPNARAFRGWLVGWVGGWLVVLKHMAHPRNQPGGGNRSSCRCNLYLKVV